MSMEIFEITQLTIIFQVKCRFMGGNQPCLMNRKASHHGSYGCRLQQTFLEAPSWISDASSAANEAAPG
jgi:hypothetical protein